MIFESNYCDIPYDTVLFICECCEEEYELPEDTEICPICESELTTI